MTFTDAIVLGDVAKRSSALALLSNRDHLFERKPVASMPLPSSSSIFSFSIFDIVVLCAEKEMIRPNAPRIVAMMAYIQSFLDLIVVHLPRESVSCYCGTVGQANCSVAIPIELSDPQPASGRLLNLRPEMIYRKVSRLPVVFEVARTATELASAPLDFSGESLKRQPTFGTLCNRHRTVLQKRFGVLAERGSFLVRPTQHTKAAA